MSNFLLDGAWLLDLCFRMDSALEVGLAYTLDLQRVPDRAYFHPSYLLGNLAIDSCWCYDHSFGSVMLQCFV